MKSEMSLNGMMILGKQIGSSRGFRPLEPILLKRIKKEGRVPLAPASLMASQGAVILPGANLYILV